MSAHRSRTCSFQPGHTGLWPKNQTHPAVLLCDCVWKDVPLRHAQRHMQTIYESECPANSKRACISAQYSDPQTFMLSHWQLWVIAPCSVPDRSATFNYVTKCACSPALMSPAESWKITFTPALCENASLPKSRKHVYESYEINSHHSWCWGLSSYVLRMISTLKIM